MLNESKTNEVTIKSQSTARIADDTDGKCLAKLTLFSIFVSCSVMVSRSICDKHRRASFSKTIKTARCPEDEWFLKSLKKSGVRVFPNCAGKHAIASTYSNKKWQFNAKKGNSV